MSDKLIEAFLQMHDKKQINEAGGVNLQKAKTSPNLLSGTKQTSAITAREPAEPSKTFGQKAAEIGRGIEAGLRGAAAGATDFGQTSLGFKPLSQYVTDFITPGREQKLSQEFPRITSASKEAGTIGSYATGAGGLLKGGVKTAAKKADDVIGAVKGIDGEVTTAMPRPGYKDITPSSSTAVARTAKDVKPTGSNVGPSSALSRPNSSSVGPAMKTVDEVPPRLAGPAPARALPSASDTSKALGGFGKVPMGKVAGGAAAVGAGIGAATLGSKPAGEVKAAAPAKSDADMTKSIKAREPAEAPSKPESYKVSKGDTLSDLAKKWNVSVADIAKANQGIKDVHKIGIGQELVKPEATGNKIYQYGIGTKAGPSQSQNIQKPKLKVESTEMTNRLIDAFMRLHSTNSSNLFAEAKKAKKLDPVGKEDDDIDNDGDKDKSDSYLHNRRKAIKAAMKEAKDPYGENDGGVHKIPPREMTPEEKPKPKVGNSKVTQTGKNTSSVTKSTNEEVEQDIDESIAGLVAGTAMGALAGYGGMKSGLIPKGVEKAASMLKKLKKKTKPVKEEVEFSEAELAHIAAILEANPVAPVPDDYSGAAGGVSKRDLSDETVAEEEMKRGRGRPKGSKSGARTKSGGSVTGESETKNLAAQIRFAAQSGARDGKGNYMLKHPTTGQTKAVSAKAATEFYNKYASAEKPAQKQAHHDEFLAKHFGGGEKPKTGISLPKIPGSKS